MRSKTSPATLAEAHSALAALAAEDLREMTEQRRLDRLAGLIVASDRIVVELARTVRQAELIGAAAKDGLPTMEAWLRVHGHLSKAEAAGVVRAGRSQSTRRRSPTGSSPPGGPPSSPGSPSRFEDRVV
jgi:hypothetical protein